MTRDPDAASIMTPIAGTTRSLNLKTIAEGVEKTRGSGTSFAFSGEIWDGEFTSVRLAGGVVKETDGVL